VLVVVIIQARHPLSEKEKRPALKLQLFRVHARSSGLVLNFQVQTVPVHPAVSGHFTFEDLVRSCLPPGPCLRCENTVRLPAIRDKVPQRLKDFQKGRLPGPIDAKNELLRQRLELEVHEAAVVVDVNALQHYL